MEYTYQFSEPVSPHRYEANDYFSVFIPRIHRDMHLADKAAQECRFALEAGDVSKAKAFVAKSLSSFGVEGQKLLNEWIDWQKVIGQEFDMDGSLEDFKSHQLLEGGARPYFSMFLFGAGIILSEEDKEVMYCLCEMEFFAIFLANDYFSSDKEYAEFLPGEDSRLPESAVSYFMKHDSLCLVDARRKVKDLIMETEQQYVRGKSEYLSGSPNVNIVECFKLVELVMAGYMVWCVTVPRYKDPADSEKSNLPDGTRNPLIGNFTALCYCEVLPERLPVIAYINEMAFLLDDAQESTPKSGSSAESEDEMSGTGTGPEDIAVAEDIAVSEETTGSEEIIAFENTAASKLVEAFEKATISEDTQPEALSAPI